MAEEDISRVDGVQRNPEYARLIMQAYARCSATMASIESVRKSIKMARSEIARATVDSYLAVLNRLHLIDDLPAWKPSLRDKTRITQTPTRHFVDPSLAVAALGASPAMLLKDLPTMGLLFESLCVRDLRVYAARLKGSVFHYRDASDLEADAIIVLHDGRWGAIEIKLGEGLIEDGVSTLARLCDRVDSDVMGAPSFTAVVIPSGYAHRRPDGVYVVPITCLAP